jgi:hypothetical protein
MSHTDNQPPTAIDPATTPAPASKSRAPWLIAGTLAALLIAGAVTGILVAARPAHVATATSTGDVQTQVEEHGAPAPADVCGYLEDLCATTPAVPAVSVTPKAADIKLTAKVTSKHCFGSAGCNVEFRVKMAYSGPDLSADDTWEVTYEVTGVEDGPLLGSFDITGDTYDVNEEIAGTTSSSKKISIKVTAVDKVGL